MADRFECDEGDSNASPSELTRLPRRKFAGLAASAVIATAFVAGCKEGEEGKRGPDARARHLEKGSPGL